MIIIIPRRPKYVQLMRDSPRRLPHWRWELAGRFHESSCDPEVRRDPWILTGAKLRKMTKALTFHWFNEVVQDAIAIWHDNTIQRWEIESRVLAKQTTQEIAHAVSQTPKTILAYERIFYDIRDRLSCRDYIAGCVLQQPVQPSCRDVGAIWSRMAYWHGAAVLDALVGHLRRRGWTDYQPLLSEEGIPRGDKMDLAIERSLLLMLLSDTLTPEQLVKVAHLSKPSVDLLKFAPEYIDAAELPDFTSLVLNAAKSKSLIRKSVAKAS